MSRRPARVRLLCLVAAVAVAGLARLEAQSPSKHFLWKVESGAKVLYLAGSIHALSADVYPLHPAFEQAFAQSGTLVEEIDLNTASSMTAAPMLMQKGMLPPGRTFDQVVSRETVLMTTARFEELGLPAEMALRMKPWMVMLMLTAAQTTKAGLDAGLGLDKYFFDKAAAAGKPVVGLETVEFQIDRFDQMSDLTQEQLLRNALNELDTSNDVLPQMLATWSAGDAAAFEKIVLSGFDDYPAVYASLIVERNRAWLPTLDACLARPTPCFVVVGAAHLVGRDGLVAAMRQKGYRVTQQ